jgi:hypothetical protein
LRYRFMRGGSLEGKKAISSPWKRRWHAVNAASA